MVLIFKTLQQIFWQYDFISFCSLAYNSFGFLVFVLRQQPTDWFWNKPNKKYNALIFNRFLETYIQKSQK